MTDPRPSPATSPPPDSEPATDDVAALEAVTGRGPKHTRDRAPRVLLLFHENLVKWLSFDFRLRISFLILVVAVVIALVLSSARVLRFVFEALDILAFVGLFLVNWLGNGGALVPVPGARFIGLLMIFQHAVILPSWEVFVVSGAAMSLGLLSYYLAGVRTAAAYDEGDVAGAEQLAADSGMLDGVTGLTDTDVDAGAGAGRRTRMKRRVSASWRQAQERARPTVERRGTVGIFLLCIWPTPVATAAAFLGGSMGLGFTRYLAGSFAAKYLLAGIVVVGGLVFGATAATVTLPF